MSSTTPRSPETSRKHRCSAETGEFGASPVMISTLGDTFEDQRPYGADVFDARGRKLTHVIACNPITGEVVTLDLRPAPFDRLLFRLRKPQHRWWYWLLYSHFVQHRHGFWPAPLRVVPHELNRLLANQLQEREIHS
jgi:hypothetical protein